MGIIELGLKMEVWPGRAACITGIAQLHPCTDGITDLNTNLTKVHIGTLKTAAVRTAVFHGNHVTGSTIVGLDGDDPAVIFCSINGKILAASAKVYAAMMMSGAVLSIHSRYLQTFQVDGHAPTPLERREENTGRDGLRGVGLTASHVTYLQTLLLCILYGETVEFV